ncbi:universal stress protein [Flavobacterium sp. RSP29]|uniref:universal stress protein n=1 Tax=Flavobacterium sp. RSP29 TaxID=3401731 RepID=UPI003AABCE23
MKKILFPTDFSEVASNAFVHALEFANIVKGELILLHTFELPIYDNQFFPENYVVIYDSLQLAKFNKFKDEIPKLRAIAEEHNLGNIKISHRLMDGDLLYNIKKSIKEDKIDFVIMGTSGATGWDAFFVGTNAGAVISGIEVPMLCVPAEAKFKKIKNIGFTTRFRTKDKKALKMVLDIATKTNAKVKCVYVKTNESDVSKDTIASWEEEFIQDPIEFFIINSNEVKETILDFIMYKEIDILTMLTYKRGFFEGIFKPSLTKEIATNYDIPILAVHID